MVDKTQCNWKRVGYILVAGLLAFGCFIGGGPKAGHAQSISQDQFDQLPSDVQKRIQEYSPANQPGTNTNLPQKDLPQAASQAQGDQESTPKKASDSSSNEPPDTSDTEAKNASLSKIENIYNSSYRERTSFQDEQDEQTDAAERKKKPRLRQFGYNLFESYAKQLPSHVVPDSSYVLGSGDVLRVRIWGSDADSEFTAPIRSDGKASMPKIGVISLAGSSLGEAEKILEKEFDKYIQGINLSVSLEELRSIEVYVVGAVQEPGLHMLPAFSSTLHALLAAQGVEKTGSLRRIQLLREDKEVNQIDLYKLLLEGKRQDAVGLQDRDVIFVPRIGPTAAVRGGVVQEGIFELKKEDSVGDLLDLAGGMLPQGSAKRLHLYRYADNSQAEVLDVGDDIRPESWRNETIASGDLLDVRIMGPETDTHDAVRLDGHVLRPDVFAYAPDMALSDVLSSPEQLKPGAITQFGLLYRYNPETTRYSVKRFPLDDVLEGEYDTELSPRDRIVVLSRQEKEIQETLRIAGAVWQDGQYSYHPDMQVADLISMAGGTKFGAQLGQVEVSRQFVENGSTKTKHIALENAEQRQEFTLQPFDYVFIPMAKGAQETETVELTGEVRFPGTYRIKNGEQISDLIRRAGGFTDKAYFFGAKFTSPEAQEIQQESVDQLVRELEARTYQQMAEQTQTAISKEEAALAQESKANLQGFIDKLDSIEVEGRVAITLANLETFADSRYDFELDDGDTLDIPKRPNFVAVTGSVYSPSAYLYQPGMTAEDYLSKAGGATKTADEDYMYILRANGEVISKQQGHAFSNPFASTELMPGDTVVVPENLDRVPYLRLVRDVSDIVFKIATTAGVAVSLM